MHAVAAKRWLWGTSVAWVAWLAALLGGLGPGPGPARAAAAKAGASQPATAVAAPAPGQASAPQVHIPPFGAPTAMLGLGEELARALYAALREANIPARLGKGDDGSAIAGRLEELSQAQVRLHASYRGHSVQSVGDLEHLDDLVYAVFAQLRPWLQPTASATGTAASDEARLGAFTPPTSPESGTGPGPEPGKQPSAPSAQSKDTPKDAAHTPPGRLASAKDSGPHSGTAAHKHLAPPTSPPASKIELQPISTAVPSKTTPSVSTPTGTPENTPTPGGSGNKETPGPIASTNPPTPPATPGPGTESPPTPPAADRTPPRPSLPALDPRRPPRVAVHVVGEPVARVATGYYGLGAVGQHDLISYLQQRLRVPAVASRLVGLTGGLAAIDQSLLLGARHTLMARLDSLVLTASPGTGIGAGMQSAGTLTGRLHIVLLLDGKLLFDRSITMPPTLVLAAESPAQAYSRMLFAAMDTISGELAARLMQPPPG